MWNAGLEPARMIEVISPAGFEHFFRESRRPASRRHQIDRICHFLSGERREACSRIGGSAVRSPGWREGDGSGRGLWR
jgi:hypothetical protein